MCWQESMLRPRHLVSGILRSLFQTDPCPSYENSFPKRSGRWRRLQGKDIGPCGRGRSHFRHRATVAGPGCHINRQFCRSHRPGLPKLSSRPRESSAQRRGIFMPFMILLLLEILHLLCSILAALILLFFNQFLGGHSVKRNNRPISFCADHGTMPNILRN